MKNKKIIFLTGTRADFGKIKSLLRIVIKDDNFHVYLFVTGMPVSYTHLRAHET